jgi:hypothetical protein
MSTAPVSKLGELYPEVVERLKILKGVQNAFTKDDYSIDIKVEDDNLIVEVFQKAAPAPVDEPAPASEDATVNEPGNASIEESIPEETEIPDTTAKIATLVNSNYDTIIQLLKSFKTFPEDTQFDQIYKIIRPINKSTSSINKDFLTKIGRTKGIKIEKGIYKTYITNKLLNIINGYFVDYYLHSTGRQPNGTDTTELLNFISNQIQARERNGVDLSEYKTVMNEIKSDPRIQSILTELNKQTGNELANVLAEFNPAKKLLGGKHRPLRQTRKLRKSNE